MRSPKRNHPRDKSLETAELRSQFFLALGSSLAVARGQSMGLAARQRSFQRALSVSAYNGMDWRLQKRTQTRSLKAFRPSDFQAKES